MKGTKRIALLAAGAVLALMLAGCGDTYWMMTPAERYAQSAVVADFYAEDSIPGKGNAIVFFVASPMPPELVAGSLGFYYNSDNDDLWIEFTMKGENPAAVYNFLIEVWDRNADRNDDDPLGTITFTLTGNASGWTVSAGTYTETT